MSLQNQLDKTKCGCDKPRVAHGLCQHHYDLMRRPRKGRFKGSDTERFWKSVEKTEGCWIWTGGKFSGSGYGQFHVRRKPEKNWRAHRFSYVHFVGPIPEGMTLDHLCRNKICVNPEHLEPVTAKVNLQRKPKQTVCSKGHQRLSGTRRCGICASEARKARYYKTKLRTAMEQYDR